MMSTSTHFRHVLFITSAILLLCGVLGCFARYYWFFDLFSNFVPQYALAGGALAFLLLLQACRKMAFVMLAFAILNVYQMNMLWKQDEGAIGKSMYDDVTIIQFNVNKRNTRIDDITTWLIQQSHKTDIIALFEVTDKWKEALGKLAILYPYHFTHSMREDRDVAIFSKLPVKQFKSQPLRNLDVPIILVDLETSKNRIPWLLGMIHPAPPVSADAAEKRNNVLKSAARRMVLHQRSAVSGRLYQNRVLVGDFNVTPWSPHFNDMLKISNLRDAQNGKGLMGTWPSSLGDKLGIPIDHMLVSSHVKVIARDVGSSLGSDHLPVITTLGMPVMVKRRM